ncbi:MAG: DinB family protein [Desulfovibrio sp.]
MAAETTPTANMVTEQLLLVLHECLHGADESGAFLDPGDDGLFSLLAGLSAEEASRPVAGFSVATHAFHLATSFDVFLDWISGKRDIAPDWDESWARSETDDEEWAALRHRLEQRGAVLEAAVAEHVPLDTQSAWGAAGLLAHTAFHLGALRVKFDLLRP